MITFVSNDRYETKESVILFMLDSHLDIIGNRTSSAIIHCHARLARPLYRNKPEELIDLMHAGQKAEIVTKLGGKAEMTLLQDSLLSIDLSKRSKMEIRWYDTTGNDTIIALVNTVYAPAGDSRIRFFDTAWKELPASERIRQIRREEFFQFPDSLTKAKKEDLLRPVDIFLVEYNFATDGSLCARQSWANYLDKESSDRIEPYLQDSIVLHWNGKRFK